VAIIDSVYQLCDWQKAVGGKQKAVRCRLFVEHQLYQLFDQNIDVSIRE